MGDVADEAQPQTEDRSQNVWENKADFIRDMLKTCTLVACVISKGAHSPHYKTSCAIPTLAL